MSGMWRYALAVSLCLHGIAHKAEGGGVMLEPLPGRVQGEDKAFVLVHGALVNEKHYTEVCRKVQQASPLRLWVGIPSFLFDTPNPLQVSAAVKAMVKQIGAAANRTMQPGDVVVGGHSLGGVFAPAVVKSEGYAAMVEWGSYVTQGQSIATTAFPVLTLAGELDGLTRVTRIALEYEKMAGLPPAEWARKPVVVLPGVCHSQFCSGYNVSGDNMPAVPWPEAQDGIANVTAAFLTTVLPPAAAAAAYVAAATARLASGFNYTRGLVRGFLAARRVESSDDANTNWCGTAQRTVLFAPPNATRTAPYQLKVKQASNLAVLATMHPSLSNGTGAAGPTVEVVAYASYSFNPEDISTFAVAAQTLTCEMMSDDALRQAQGDPTAGGRPVVPDQCRAINEAAMAYAETVVTPATLARYRQSGIPASFAADATVSTGPGFLASSLKFKTSDGHATVSSTALATPTTASVFGGVYECQLLSPARAIEWMMVDGLPKLS